MCYRCFDLSLKSSSEQQPEVKEFSLTSSSEQRLEFEENTLVELAAQNDADPTNYDDEVDHLTTERHQMLEENTAVGVAAQNNADPRNDNGGVDQDTGEGQRSEIEALYDSTAADFSSGTPPLFGQESIRGPAEHTNSFTMGSKRNEHPPSLGQRDPVTPISQGSSRIISPDADSATSDHSSGTRRLLSEQASPIEKVQGCDLMVRDQRYIRNSGPASVGASSSRAPEALWVQNRPNRLMEDAKGYDIPYRDSVPQNVLTQMFRGPVTSGNAHSEPLRPTRRNGSRLHTLPPIDEGTNERVMVTRQHNFHRNPEVVREISLNSPSPQPRTPSPGNTKPSASDRTQALNAPESQVLANPDQDSSGTADALPPHILANLRREYKEGLLDVARAWPGPPNELTLRSLIKMDDRRDDNRQFRIAEDKIHRDWENYENYARIGRFRNSSLPFPVYGHPCFRDLDILKLWVNLNQHICQTWPPGYIPQNYDEYERDGRYEISSIGTEDQMSIFSE